VNPSLIVVKSGDSGRISETDKTSRTR